MYVFIDSLFIAYLFIVYLIMMSVTQNIWRRLTARLVNKYLRGRWKEVFAGQYRRAWSGSVKP
jgi:hypothetical protein